MSFSRECLSGSWWCRAVTVAAFAAIVTLVLGAWEIVTLTLYVRRAGVGASVPFDAKTREVLRWLYLSAAGFLSTLACAAVFEWMWRLPRPWLRRCLAVLLVPITIGVLLFASAVAYIPERRSFEQGMIVEIPALARWATLLAGGFALVLAGFIRKRRAGV